MPSGGESLKLSTALFNLNPQAGSLLFAAVLLLLQPIQIEEVDPVFQIGGLNMAFC